MYRESSFSNLQGGYQILFSHCHYDLRCLRGFPSWAIESIKMRRPFSSWLILSWLIFYLLLFVLSEDFLIFFSVFHGRFFVFMSSRLIFIMSWLIFSKFVVVSLFLFVDFFQRRFLSLIFYVCHHGWFLFHGWFTLFVVDFFIICLLFFSICRLRFLAAFFFCCFFFFFPFFSTYATVGRFSKSLAWSRLLILWRSSFIRTGTPVNFPGNLISTAALFFVRHVMFVTGPCDPCGSFISEHWFGSWRKQWATRESVWTPRCRVDKWDEGKHGRVHIFPAGGFSSHQLQYR